MRSTLPPSSRLADGSRADEAVLGLAVVQDGGTSSPEGGSKRAAKTRIIPAVGSPDGCPALSLTSGTGPSRVTEAGIRRNGGVSRSLRQRPKKPPHSPKL